MWYAVVVIVSALISYFAIANQKMSKATVGTVEAPTAEEGREIPVLFGTRVIKSMNVGWYGDISTTPVKK